MMNQAIHFIDIVQWQVINTTTWQASDTITVKNIASYGEFRERANFDLGSSRVDPSSLPYIEAIASVLRSDPSLSLVIEGHTDDRGSYNRNMVLSWDRALGVFRTLVEGYGIDPGRLRPMGLGPNSPMPGTLPSDGANRRVQFRVNG